MLGLHRRRQDDVGVQRGVGQALLEHDREQVLAREARVHARVVGVAGGGVRVEDDERRDRRVVGLEQRLAEARHVDRARRRARRSSGTVDAARVDAAEMAARHAQQRRRRRAGSRRSRRAAPGSRASPRRAPPWRCSPRPSRIPVGRVCAKRSPEREHALDRQAADRGGALDRPLGQPRLELGPALGVALEPVAILGALVEHDAHEAERERGVRAGPRREVLVAAARPCRVRSGSIATTCAPACCAASTKRHWWRFVESRLAPHSRISLRVLEVLGIHAHGAAVGGAQRGARGRRADRRLEPRRAERGEQPRPHDPALDHALGAGEVVRQIDSRAVPLDRRAQAGGDRVERLVPADPLERAPRPWRRCGAAGAVTRPGPLTASR